METFPALLAIYARNSSVSGEFPAQRPVTRSFDVFFDLCLNKWLSKQWWGWWFETPSRPLWRYCNVAWALAVKLVLQTLPNEKSPLVQLRVGGHQASSHCPHLCWPRQLGPYGVITPQWVKWRYQQPVLLNLMQSRDEHIVTWTEWSPLCRRCLKWIIWNESFCILIQISMKLSLVQVMFNELDKRMTSSNGNIFRVTGPLCGEITGQRWIPLTKASDAELWCFLWSAPWI